MSALPADFVSLYSDHHRWLKTWLMRKLGNECDAADLAHDTYVRLIDSQRFPAVDEAAASRRYLGRIANGLMVDLYRRRKIEAAYLDALAHWPEALAPSEEDRALAIAALMEVDAILHALPAKARAAFLMFKLDGMSYLAIAKELRVSVSSVEKYIAKSLQACFMAMSKGQI